MGGEGIYWKYESWLKRNGARFYTVVGAAGEYLRLDLSVHLQWNTFWGSIEPYLEIINVFNHKNVSFRFYDVQMNEDGTLKLVTRDGTQFPFLPFIGVNVRW